MRNWETVGKDEVLSPGHGSGRGRKLAAPMARCGEAGGMFGRWSTATYHCPAANDEIGILPLQKGETWSRVSGRADGSMPCRGMPLPGGEMVILPLQTGESLSRIAGGRRL